MSIILTLTTLIVNAYFKLYYYFEGIIVLYRFKHIINKKLNLANLTKHESLMVSELNGEELKIIQVIKRMINSPDLMVMDEPDAFLDVENLKDFKNLINSH